MRRVLVLRPEPGASETVKGARDRGLDAFAIPLFEIEPLEWRAPDPTDFDGLLLTSAGAVRQGGPQLERLRRLAVFAVGEATAGAARDAGFSVAAVGDAGADRLLDSIDANLRLLHLCGEGFHEPRRAARPVTRLTIYRARPIPDPNLGAIGGSVALVHSPRAGQRFAELVADRGSIAIAAISPSAAKATGDGWESVTAIDRPSDEALLALAESLCNKSARQ